MIPIPRPAVPFDGCQQCGGATRRDPLDPHRVRCNDCGAVRRLVNEATVTDHVAKQRQAYGGGMHIVSRNA